jgi:hypothetical protein
LKGTALRIQEQMRTDEKLSCHQQDALNIKEKQTDENLNTKNKN